MIAFTQTRQNMDFSDWSDYDNNSVQVKCGSKASKFLVNASMPRGWGVGDIGNLPVKGAPI